MANLGSYILDSDWEPVSNGAYAYATKDGVKYFIKRLLRPKYPLNKSSKIFEQKLSECKEWKTNKNRLLNELKKIAGPSGNVVVPLELLRIDASFYIVSLRIIRDTMSPSDISALSYDEKILLLKTMVASIGTVHQAKIVHGDLKPENILVTRSEHGKLISKIIDLDDSYFESAPPEDPESVVGSGEYYSPELANYVIDKNISFREKITCKSDVFALGVIFHEYLTGHRPGNPKLPKANAYYVVGKGKELVLDSTIKPDMVVLLKQMLRLYPDQRPTCIDILNMLKKMEESRSTGHITKPIAEMSSGDDERISHIVPLSLGMFKVEYESGRFVTVPLIYIKTNKLEDYLKLESESGIEPSEPEPLDVKLSSPLEEEDDEIKRITPLSRSMFRIEYESGRFVSVPLIYIKANKLEDRVEK